MSPLEGFYANFDVGVEQVDVSPSDGPREQFVLYTDSVLWDQVMTTKDLQPELLWWYLQLKKFDFVARDKANVYALSDPNQA